MKFSNFKWTIKQRLSSIIKLNNFYRKMFLLYSSFTLVIVIFSSIFLMNFFSENLEKEINASNKNLLEQIRSFSDKFLISEINVPLSEFIVNTYSKSASNSAVLDFLFKKNTTFSSSAIVRTYRELLRIQMRHDFIESIYLYRVFDDTLISSKEGFVLKALTRNFAEESYFNTFLIEKAIGMENTRTWISPLENTNYWKNNSILSVIQSIPYYPSEKEQQGYVIINIDTAKFMKSLINTDTNLVSSYFLAVDTKGRVFLNSNHDEVLTPLVNKEQMDRILEFDSGFKVISANKNNYAIQWIRSLINDWTYISYIPMQSLNKQIFKSRQLALLFIGLITIVSLAGTHFISRFFTKFVQRAIRDIRKKLNMKSNQQNSLNPLISIVHDLETRAEEFEEVRKKNRTLILYKLVTDLLYGNIANEESLKQRLDLINKDFGLKKYCLIIIEPDISLYGKLSFEQREFVRYMIIKTTEEYFEQFCNSLCISLPDSHITAILNLDTTSEIKSNIIDLQIQLKKEIKFDHNIAISNSVNNLTQIARLYNQTQKYLEYRYFLEYGNIFTQEKINRLESNSLTFHISTLKQYEIQINSRKYNEFKSNFLDLYNSIKSGQYSLAIAKNIAVQFINLIIRLAREQGMDREELKEITLFRLLEDIKFISSYKELIFSIIDIYRECVDVRNLHIEDGFFEKISSFIKMNIDNDLSQRSVAEEFSISQSHLSRVFKEAMGVSFSDFVIKTKYERASELLIEEKDVTITEIAKRLGYLDLPYFSKLFKERYGMTPSRYRKRYYLK